MTTKRLKSGLSAYVDRNRPAANMGGASTMSLKDNDNFGFLYIGQEYPLGAVILSATLFLTPYGTSGGARTISLRSADKRWGQNRINFNNRPGTEGVVASQAVTVLSDHRTFSIDVTSLVQQIANTGVNRGWRIATTGTTEHRVFGFNSYFPPSLLVEYTYVADPPTDLAPSAGLVATPYPTLSFTYVEADDAADLVSLRVQIDADQSGTTPDWDSGWVNTSVPELNLAGTSFPGLTSTPTFWRAAIRNSFGMDSEWSDWVPLTYAALAELEVTNPGGDGLVYDVTPEVTWEFAGTQVAWQVRITTAADPSVILDDSGKITSDETAYEIPKGVLVDESQTYMATVRVWDDVLREAVPGYPTFATDSKPFILADGTTGAPTGLVANPDPVTPEVVLTWTATQGERFTIVRDGQVVDTLDAAEVHVSGNSYQWRDWTAQPLIEHTYRVRAIVGRNQSKQSGPAVITMRTPGVWLVDPASGVWITANGAEGMDQWDYHDTFSIYEPLGSGSPVKITSSQRGLSGGFGGAFWPGEGGGRTVEEQIANLLLLKQRPDRVLRMIAGDLNIPVVVADLSAAAHSEIKANLRYTRVSWQFWQYGELPFTSRL